MKNVLLLDGYNLIYRARYSGMNKGDHSTIFNFFRSLRPLIEKFNTDKAYFILEGSPKKRLEADPNYKGQRVYDNKDNFKFQRNKIIDLLHRFFPIQLVKHDDYECDDIIGYLANEHKHDSNVTIVSSDTDFIQCIDENVRLYNPVRKKDIVKPDYDYVLWKSLKGDASDNIQGFKGIGDKRAKVLCENSTALSDFIGDSEEKREKLDNNIFMIKLHDLKEDANNIRFYNYIEEKNWDELREIFKGFEFSSMINKDTTWNKYINTFDRLFER